MKGFDVDGILAFADPLGHGFFRIRCPHVFALAGETNGTIVDGTGRVLGAVAGPIGKWTFLVGFWGAVATSMLGVWQGVPYLFADFVSGNIWTLRQPGGGGVEVDVVDTDPRPADHLDDEAGGNLDSRSGIGGLRGGPQQGRNEHRPAGALVVDPEGPACHTGSRTCFGDESPTAIGMLDELRRDILALDGVTSLAPAGAFVFNRPASGRLKSGESIPTKTSGGSASSRAAISSSRA